MSLRTTTFLLIHGAFHGAWCWQKLTVQLTRAGYKVHALDLPGAGQDRTPLAEVSFASYVDRVLDVLDRIPEQVILIGHSFGGMTISQVAEQRSEKIRWLVYLSALLPRPGETSLEAQARSVGPDHPLFSCIEMGKSSMCLRFEEASPFFYHDCAPEEILLARRFLKPQPLLPIAAPVSLSEHFARVPRAYLNCTLDRMLTPEAQSRLYTQTPCERVIDLQSGHSPFLSMPAQLAACLDGLAKTDPTGTLQSVR